MKVRPTTSTLFEDTEYVPPAHLTGCDAPAIWTAIGEYPVAPWLIIMLAVITRLFVVGRFVKFAVKFVEAVA